MIISIVSLLCLIPVLFTFQIVLAWINRFQLIVRFLIVADPIVIVCIIIDIRVTWSAHFLLTFADLLLLLWCGKKKSVGLTSISVVIWFLIMRNIHLLIIVRCKFTSLSAAHRYIWCHEIDAIWRVNFNFLRVLRTSKFT